MPVIGFKKEFVPGIKSGKKPQTIRPAGKRKYKPGDRLYMYTGDYRKGKRPKIGEAVVSDVVPIEFKVVNKSTIPSIRFVGFVVSKDNLYRMLGYGEMAALAKLDGFDEMEGFEDFFINTYKLKPGDSKDFVIIKWQNFEPA